MPIAITSPVDGEVPQNYRPIGDDWQTDPAKWQVKPEEVVIPDADFRPGWVWDAANKRLRASNDADRLRWAKRQKKEDGEVRMHRENRSLYPNAQKVEGGWVAQMVLDALKDPRGQSIAAIQANNNRRTRYDAAVDAATSVEAVNAVSWEAV